MDELMNLIIADESPSEISDSIKNQLFGKALVILSDKIIRRQESFFKNTSTKI